MKVEDVLESIWEQTGRFILKNDGEGGYVVEENPTTYGEFPVGFNDVRNPKNLVHVSTDAEVDVAEMFWCPHVHEKTREMFRMWMKKNGISDEALRARLAYYVTQFRDENKDVMFGIARRMLHEDLPKPVKHTVVTVKVKPAVRMKPIHKNSAVVGTGVTATVISVAGLLYHTLPPDVGSVVVGIVAVILAMIEHTSVKKVIEEIEE